MQVCDSEDTLDDELTRVECTLPRALLIFSPVRPDASVPANGLWTFPRQQKARRQVIGQKEEVEF